MPWSSVLPAPLTSRTIRSHGDEPTDATQIPREKAVYPVYILEASHKLPIINADRTVKSLILRKPHHLKRFTQWTWRAKRILNACFALGCVVTWLFGFVDIDTSRVLALVSFALLFMPTMIGFMVMRYDVMQLLTTTYEFWFVTANLTIESVLLVLYFGDGYRSLLVLMTFVCYINSFLADASYSDVKATTITLVMGAFSVFVFVMCVAFQTMPETHTVVLFAYNEWTLEARDVILNSLGIALLLVTRNAYRKYVFAPKPTLDGDVTAFVRLTAYRVTVRFVRRTTSLNSQGASDESPATTAATGFSTQSSVASFKLADPPKVVGSQSPLANRKLSQLIFVPPPMVFHSRDVVIRRALAHIPSNATGSRLMTAFALLSYVLNIATKYLPWHSNLTQQLATTALVCSFVYCGICFAALNRHMLLLLFRSFDVLFLVVQFSCSSLMLAYLLDWQFQCILLITSSLWSLWLLTTDALTPVIKQRLGVSRLLLMIVLLGLIFEQVALTIELVIQRNLQIQDREIFSFAFTARHKLVTRAIPFLFTRMFSTFWWTWRLLWRVCTQDANDLIVIQGAVEYEDYALLERLQKRKAKKLLRSQMSARPVRPRRTRPTQDS